MFLHAHLPYVRDPEDENGLAEAWFFEAVTETYIPLLSIAEGWVRDGLPARMTGSLSPPLLEMLRDELLLTRYVDRMHALLELADSEVRRTASDERFRATAEMNRADSPTLLTFSAPVLWGPHRRVCRAPGSRST